MQHLKLGENGPAAKDRICEPNMTEGSLNPSDPATTHRKLSPEKLYALRRLRQARRLWKKEPLFAFATMAQAYPDYTHSQFLKDLTRRRPRRSKRRARKPLCRYGRYSKMMELLARYHNTGDTRAAMAAISMRKIMTHPYRMRVHLLGACYEYTLSAMIPYAAIENLNRQICKATTWQQVEQLITACRKLAAGGR